MKQKMFKTKKQKNINATILKEYMRKGFALDDDRLKNLGGGGYFKKLLDRAFGRCFYE